MFTARKKIVKEKGAEPDDFEETVAQVCHCFKDTCMEHCNDLGLVGTHGGPGLL